MPSTDQLNIDDTPQPRGPMPPMPDPSNIDDTPQPRGPLQQQQWNPLEQQPPEPEGPFEGPSPTKPWRVAPDQTASAAGFMPGDPAPSQPMLPPPPPARPFGPFGPPPFQRAPQQTFIPSSANRQPQQWGSPRQYPMMPQMWEVPGIYNGIGGQIAQWGSGMAAPFGAMLGQNSGAWMKGYAQGQELRARMQHQEMVNAATGLELQLQAELREYGSIMAIFGDGKHPQQLEQALRNAAGKFQDEHLKSALDTVGLPAAERYVSWLDAKYGDLHATNAQRAKDQAQRERLSPWQENPTDQTGLPAQQTTPPPADEGVTPAPQTPEQVAPPPPAGAAPGEEPPPDSGPPPSLDIPGGGPSVPVSQGAAQPQQQRPQLAERGDVMSDAPQPGVASVDEPTTPDQQERQRLNLPKLAEAGTPASGTQYTPPGPSETLQRAQTGPYRLKPALINSVAQEVVNGTRKANDKSIPTEVQPYVTARAAEINQELDRIQKSNLKGQQALDEIERIDPALAGQLKGYVSGAFPVPTGSRNLPIINRIIGLGSKIDPTFTAQTAPTRAGTLKSYAYGKDAQNLTSLGTFYLHAQQMRKDLEELKQLDPATYQLWLSQYRVGGVGKMVADPKLQGLIGRLNADLEVVSNEFQRAVTGGKPTVSGASRERGELDFYTKDTDVILSTLDTKIGQVKARMDELRMRFVAGTGRGQADMLKLFDDYANQGRIPASTDELGTGERANNATSRALHELITSPGQQPQQRGPQQGAEEDGYVFQGGDPRDKNNWKKK